MQAPTSSPSGMPRTCWGAAVSCRAPGVRRASGCLSRLSDRRLGAGSPPRSARAGHASGCGDAVISGRRSRGIPRFVLFPNASPPSPMSTCGRTTAACSYPSVMTESAGPTPPGIRSHRTRPSPSVGRRHLHHEPGRARHHPDSQDPDPQHLDNSSPPSEGKAPGIWQLPVKGKPLPAGIKDGRLL